MKYYIRMMTIIISAVGVLIMIGCMSVRTIVSCEDVVARANSIVTLRAKLEEWGYHIDEIENQPVEFRLVGYPVCKVKRKRFFGVAETDEEGWAETSAKVSCEGIYRFKVSYKGNKRFFPSSDELTVLAVDKEKPIIVVDIDGTLTRKGWRPWRKEPIVYDGFAVDVLNRLAKRYAIIYLSGRLLPMHGFTRKWLAKNGFPKGPIVMWWISSARWLSVRRYKSDILISIRRRIGANLVWGIGNTEDDIEAYRQAGLKAIILGKQADGAISVKSWYEIGKIISGQK